MEDEGNPQAQAEAEASEPESSPAWVELRYNTLVQQRCLQRAFGW